MQSNEAHTSLLPMRNEEKLGEAPTDIPQLPPVQTPRSWKSAIKMPFFACVLF